jgi:hypothetical protein
VLDLSFSDKSIFHVAKEMIGSRIEKYIKPALVFYFLVFYVPEDEALEPT